MIKFVILNVLFLLIWFAYISFFLPKLKSKKAKVLGIIIVTFVEILIFLSVYIYDKKNRFFTFNNLTLSVSLEYTSKYLNLDAKKGEKSEYDRYSSDMEEDIFKESKNIISEYNAYYDKSGKDRLLIGFSDTTMVNNGDRIYLIETYIRLGNNRKISVLEKIDIKNIKYDDYKKIFRKGLATIFESIKFQRTLKNKSEQELIRLLDDEKLEKIFSMEILRELLNRDTHPVIPNHIMNKFVNDVSFFSEASGYAILSNDCNTINTIIEKSIPYSSEQLLILVDILSQSKCEIAKGYIFTLTSSVDKNLKKLSLTKFKMMEDIRKKIIYENGKRKE